ncbi:NAD(P)/FAD-dependent oxidoreductase [Leptospira ilyithenensis]|uniref:NADH dehydrogenase FAD-containing subunit n=1 Tax=Leptospira ilyithenensis TaxID=2484901 RepID=A0A4R9LS79_9LEPT|nr:FAD-dependent oxidoreductase [Leptospira ilyithenensis]TGN14121.1 NADH dehydrogenase FAD-containing subunit [Leptospira ilyithenensis]
MESRKTVIIAGGGYAGIIAANRLARKKLPIQIILITAENEFHERIRNHQVLCGTLAKTYSTKSLLHKKVELKIAKITKINSVSKEVFLSDNKKLNYNYLIYALGVQKKTNEALPDTYISIAEKTDCIRMASTLQAMIRPKITILGAGLSGIETVAELAETFPAADLSLVDSGKLGAGFSEPASDWMKGYVAKHKINLMEDSYIQSFETNSLITKSGKKIEHDICILSNGLVASPVGVESGLPANEIGQLLVNGYLELNQTPDVFVAGDAAKVVSGDHDHLRMACATALPMGIYAAERLAYTLGAKSKLGEKEFKLSYLGRNVSLGRKNGVIQPSLSDDTPYGKVWKSKMAAFIKETICKLTILSFRLEKYADVYVWKG